MRERRFSMCKSVGTFMCVFVFFERESTKRKNKIERETDANRESKRQREGKLGWGRGIFLGKGDSYGLRYYEDLEICDLTLGPLRRHPVG